MLEDYKIYLDKAEVNSNKASDTTNDQYQVDSGVTSDSAEISETFHLSGEKNEAF